MRLPVGKYKKQHAGKTDVLPKNEIKLSKRHFDLLTVSRNGKKNLLRNYCLANALSVASFDELNDLSFGDFSSRSLSNLAKSEALSHLHHGVLGGAGDDRIHNFTSCGVVEDVAYDCIHGVCHNNDLHII